MFGQFGQGTRKRPARYADSDQEEEGDVLMALGSKKIRTSSIDTNQTSSFLPSHPNVATNAFISPPVTPTPMPRRQTSDIAMEDLDMADSQPASQHDWNSGLYADVHVPSFVQQDSTLSAISILDAEEQGSHIQRPHTPGIIMRDMTRLEVSPSSELQSRGWMGMGRVQETMQQQHNHHQRHHQGEAGSLGTAASKGRFTMGYRADCEKCRNRVPGHYAHPPTL
ncbi:uncharacterized protein DFL_001720 [Arthrobotrys flagrans]|uniref:Uncharacterized protein n=1 Tax=Arthrobotrys flagrans TaxID=97331 RepID=A0A437A8P4_ARTFL|nr:hypothetical protein DFL_001720 [Arthrobotrys flagrans]